MKVKKSTENWSKLEGTHKYLMSRCGAYMGLDQAFFMCETIVQPDMFEGPLAAGLGSICGAQMGIFEHIPGGGMFCSVLMLGIGLGPASKEFTKLYRLPRGGLPFWRSGQGQFRVRGEEGNRWNDRWGNCGSNVK